MSRLLTHDEQRKVLPEKGDPLFHLIPDRFLEAQDKKTLRDVAEFLMAHPGQGPYTYHILPVQWQQFMKGEWRK